jgi:hypothetical protein
MNRPEGLIVKGGRGRRRRKGAVLVSEQQSHDDIFRGKLRNFSFFCEYNA